MVGNRARTPGRHLSRAWRSIRLPSAKITNRRCHHAPGTKAPTVIQVSK